MVKILSQSGISLADVYNVQGSIAGIEQLESREVSLTHDMASTIFSERYVTTFRRLTTGDILQSVAFDVNVDNLPSTPTRILGIAVLADNAARVERCSVNVRDGSEQDIPIWSFSVGNSEPIRMLDDGSVVNLSLLIPTPGSVFVPGMIGGSGQPSTSMMDGISLRGASTAFGAGTVEVIGVVYMAFAFRAGLSSLGLPIPGW